ncbi:MAG: SAM-dependent methyltransferase [Candidatus Magnetominusculus sp. LBB02]|nr:SAM-dependent methyltransferase [Candidatus Magnetominusculus sp. LBB02]
MLKKIIIKRIRENGPMPFKDFMQEALYHPGCGYYMSKETMPFGREGDFFTASHLHPAFGASIGRQIEQMWMIMGRPSPFYIIEFGPGRALMAGDMLRYLKNTEFFACLSYVIIEANPAMAALQRQGLKDFSETKISWAARADELSPVCGCILSNELLDAFPVHLVQMENGALKQVWVGSDGDNLIEILVEPSKEIISYVEEFDIDMLRDSTAKAAIQSGYRTEINLAVRDWLKDCAAILREGFILTIDYGFPAWKYYHPARTRGTLVCYHRHKTSENPYEHIGQQDITAHVNFSAVSKWGQPHGFSPVGYASQGQFLISLGIDELLSQISLDENYQFEAIKIKRLIVPDGMGETHKVMVQYKGTAAANIPQLRGFTIRNQLADLGL